MRADASSGPDNAPITRRVARAIRGRLEPLLGAHGRAGPHEIALGLAVGAFVAFLPLLGLQLILAVLLARLLKASAVAALMGTFIGNPVTWPIIWATSYTLGMALMGYDVASLGSELGAIGRTLMALPLDAGWRTAAALLLPMLIGSFPIGLLVALMVYGVTWRLIGDRQP